MSARSHENRTPNETLRLDTAPLREFTARFATAEEIENWDKHVTANPNGGNMLQSAAYASVKNGSGWKFGFWSWKGGGTPDTTWSWKRVFPAWAGSGTSLRALNWQGRRTWDLPSKRAPGWSAAGG